MSTKKSIPKIYSERFDVVANKLLQLDNLFAHIIAQLLFVEFYSVAAKLEQNKSKSKKLYNQKLNSLNKATELIQNYNIDSENKINVSWSFDLKAPSVNYTYVVIFKIKNYSIIRYHTPYKIGVVHIAQQNINHKKSNSEILSGIVRDNFSNLVTKKFKPAIQKTEQPKEKYSIKFDDDFLNKPVVLPKRFKEKEKKEHCVQHCTTIVTDITSNMSPLEKFNKRFSRFSK